jgi:hypothetical protein
MGFVNRGQMFCKLLYKRNKNLRQFLVLVDVTSEDTYEAHKSIAYSLISHMLNFLNCRTGFSEYALFRNRFGALTTRTKKYGME